MKVNRGFTIIELLIGMGILAILVAVAAPNFSRIIQRNSVQKVVDELYSSLVIARSESIARSRPITVCALADPNSLTPTCSTTSSDWNNGWFVFTDTDSDGVLDTASGSVPADEVIHYYANTNRVGMTLSYNVAGRIFYGRRGILRANFGSFTICDNDLGFKKAIVVSSGTGRVRYSDKDSNGGALVCS
jgi:type IV fimbrial biogenesis protein FimT